MHAPDGCAALMPHGVYSGSLAFTRYYDTHVHVPRAALLMR